MTKHQVSQQLYLIHESAIKLQPLNETLCNGDHLFEGVLIREVNLLEGLLLEAAFTVGATCLRGHLLVGLTYWRGSY